DDPDSEISDAQMRKDVGRKQKRDEKAPRTSDEVEEGIRYELFRKIAEERDRFVSHAVRWPALESFRDYVKPASCSGGYLKIGRIGCIPGKNYSGRPNNSADPTRSSRSLFPVSAPTLPAPDRKGRPSRQTSGTKGGIALENECV